MIEEQPKKKKNADCQSLFQEQWVKEKLYIKLISAIFLLKGKKVESNRRKQIKKIIELIKLIRMHKFKIINYLTKIYKENS
ncbi:unnamed protein product [Paramecium sonneborni]|uniref:Uncharacterized protein n=1 Tax=Paramecium sonneborni TaxID=65129 RepID=A0A8S1QBD4_9CILI|nr:unnamed protein product [Paramecium sonneborni]